MPLALITPTGGRQEAFSLLEDCIRRQNYPGTIQWIVIDDVNPPTVTTLGQTVIRPIPAWRPGQITLGRNLAEALGHVKFDRILVIEDDEYLLPGYLSAMDAMLNDADLAGEIPARYYNVQRRVYRVLENSGHASLCQTGFRAELIPRLQSLCASPSPFIDVQLWNAHPVIRKRLERTGQVVSIKGLPGRPGIGIGHRPQGGWAKDPDLEQLQAWIGDHAELYAGFAA